MSNLHCILCFIYVYGFPIYVYLVLEAQVTQTTSGRQKSTLKNMISTYTIWLIRNRTGVIRQGGRHYNPETLDKT